VISGLDYNLRANKLYWGDWRRKAIMSSNLNGSDVKVFIEGGIHYPEGIAVDWVTGNIYWIDGKKKTIEVSDASGKLHRILVWTNLDKPRGLVLDPTRRLMYWSDWGINGKIERASMDGSNRVTILDSGVHWTNAIAIDIHTQTLYWADSILHTLQSSDINGENKKLAIPHGTNHAYDLVIFEDNAYWSDWASKTIRYGNKFFDDSPDQIQTVLPYPTGLKVVHPSLQPRVNNPCVVANGNCSQLCLLSGNPAATSNYTCACALGYTLQSDRRTCKEISTFIIVAHMSSILRIPLVDQRGPLFEVRLPFDQVRRATDVAWDSENNLVFWTDWTRRSILVSDLSGNTYRQLYNDDILQPEGIAYDWLTRKIYWIDSGYGRIEVADIDGSNRRVLVSSGLQKPRGIAVHPYRGYLYWTDWGSAPKIQRMNLDGTDQRMVVDLQISGNKHQANHITVDTATNRIYWVEYNYDRIVYADLDGRGLTVLGVDQSRNHPLGVAVHGDYVYWSNTEVVKRAPKEKRDTFDVEVVTTDISMALGIDLFHRGRTMVRTPCSEDNGGCSHICVTRPHSSGRLTASCLCPTGLKMKEDGRTCANEVTKFLLVPDKFSLKMISLDVDSPVHTHIPITGSHQFDSVDYDPLEDTIYWVNSPAGQILSVPRKGGSPKVILDHLDHAENIAVDWIGRKIYFIDSGTKSIDVCNLDGTVRKRLIWEKVDAPRSLAINLRARRLYWIDWGSDSSPSRIERAYLDGSARSVLWNMSRTGNSSSSVWPRALTVDLYSEEETVYWMDSRTLAGYRLNVNHQNAEMIVDNLKAPGGISTLGGRTYYSDLYINKMKAGVVREREEDGVERVLAVRLVSPYEVKAYDKSITLNIPLLHMHPCSRFFASGCSHLCLPSSPSGPHGSRGLSRFSCACPTGIVLGPNKLTCKEVPDELIVFGDVDTLYRIPMDAQPPVEVAVHQGSGVPVDVSFTATNEPITTRVSSSSGGKDGYIFWSEHTGYIKRMWRNGSCPEINCTFFSGEGSPQGLAVDRVTGNVYFVDLFTREIKVVSYNGRFVKTIVKVGLDRPRGIALDVEKGYMFYSDWGANPQIVRTNLAGSDAVTLTTPGSTQWPNGIAIDHTNKWLYWTDAQANTIKRMKFDGSAGELVLQRVEQPFGIDFHDDHLYWSQWGDNSLYSVSLSSSSIEDRRPVRMVTNPSRIYGLAYVHQNRLTIGTTHPCVNNNGGCPFFCLMLNPTSWKCACPDDMEDQCFETYHAVDTVTDPTVTTASSTSITPTSSPTDDATVSETTPTSDTSTLSDPTVDNNSDTPSDTVTMETTGTPTTDDTPTTKEPSTDSIVTQSPEGTIFGMSAGIFSAYIIIALLSICIITVILIICFVTFQVRRQKVALKNTLKTGAPPKGPYINIAPVNDASKVEGSMEKLDVSYTNTPTTIATPSSDKRPRCTRIMSVDDLSQGSSDIGLDIISVEHNSMGQPVSRTMSLDLLRAESRDSGMMA
jgi:sugar lactone lactonase YvrE